MSEEEFLLLDEQLSEAVGLSFVDRGKEVLARLLRSRLTTLGLTGFRDYYLMLTARKEQELRALVPLLADPSASFFQDVSALDAAVRFGPEERREDAPLRVLVAACGRGQEAYSLRLLQHERQPDLPMEIDAFDLNPIWVEEARTAEYEGRALAELGSERIRSCFERAGPDRFLLRRTFREGVRFFEANLMHPNRYTADGPYDMVFCRRVLHRFSTPARARALEGLAAALRPEGVLFLSSRDSVVDVTARFAAVRLGATIGYRKVSA